MRRPDHLVFGSFRWSFVVGFVVSFCIAESSFVSHVESGMSCGVNRVGNRRGRVRLLLEISVIIIKAIGEIHTFVICYSEDKFAQK